MYQNKSNKQYSKKYFKKAFPPNHNPLIGAMQADTLCNVRDTIYTIQELATFPGGMSLSDNSSTGIYFMMNCIIDALQFEIRHRK